MNQQQIIRGYIICLVCILSLSCNNERESTHSKLNSDSINVAATKHSNLDSTSIDSPYSCKDLFFRRDSMNDLNQFISNVRSSIQLKDTVSLLNYFYNNEPCFDSYEGLDIGTIFIYRHFYSFSNFLPILKRAFEFGFHTLNDSAYFNKGYDMYYTSEPANEKSGKVDSIEYKKWSPHLQTRNLVVEKYPALKGVTIFVNYPFCKPNIEIEVERMESVIIPYKNISVYEAIDNGNYIDRTPKVIGKISDTILQGLKYSHKYFYYTHFVREISTENSDSGYYKVNFKGGEGLIKMKDAIGASNLYRIYCAKINSKWKIIAIRFPGKNAKSEGC